MHLDQDQQRWLERTRAEWSEVMRPGSFPMGSHLFGEPQWLPEAATADARLFPSRISALNHFPHGGTVGEVGTQTGRFARQILDVCQPEHLHLFDLEFDTLMSRNPALGTERRVTLHVGDSSTNLSALPDASFDWLYIDGDHSYEGLRRDISQAVRKIRPDGTLVFNDYVLWSALEMIDYGVVPAVNELLCGGEWKVTYFALHPLMYCDIALVRAGV